MVVPDQYRQSSGSHRRRKFWATTESGSLVERHERVLVSGFRAVLRNVYVELLYYVHYIVRTIL